MWSEGLDFGKKLVTMKYMYKWMKKGLSVSVCAFQLRAKCAQRRYR